MMKKITAIMMALMMVLTMYQCKPNNEGNQGGSKLRVSCVMPINNGGKSDFTELIENGEVNWSEGRECLYLAIHGEKHQIIELAGVADGTPSILEFRGEVDKGLIKSDEVYDIWYFGHSHRLKQPYFNNNGETLTGSIANQSGRLNDLGLCHIAKTTVTALIEGNEVKLNLQGTLENQIAIALLDLENVTKLFGEAIIGTEYTLAYTGGRYELDVTESNSSEINVQSASGISYVVLFPNANNETILNHKKGNRTYAYSFYNGIKGNRLYYRTYNNNKVALKWYQSVNANSYEYVDLGLPSALLWATCNVGATAPEAIGNFYAWGETTPNAEYIKENCATSNLDDSQMQSLGYIDSKCNLTLQHDAASMNWGGDWRMPTENEFKELMDNCTWTWITQNGVSGYKVTSIVNGNYIFLPAGGYRKDTSIYDTSRGYYWISKSHSNVGISRHHHFYNGHKSVGSYNRYCGHLVRPVI